MKARNIDGIIEKIVRVVDSHKLENEGEYARWLWQNEKNNRELGINEYGCADAANILYTIGRFEGILKRERPGLKRCRICRTLKPAFLQRQPILNSTPRHIVLQRWNCLMQSRYIQSMPPKNIKMSIHFMLFWKAWTGSISHGLSPMAVPESLQS